MMEAIYYTVTGIILYVISDWILQQMELAAGRRFEQRTLIFFFILLLLAVTSFAIIKYMLVNQ